MDRAAGIGIAGRIDCIALCDERQRIDRHWRTDLIESQSVDAAGGALPLAYGLAAGGLPPMILNSLQKEELLLTSAQSLFAAVIISDFKFTLWEAMLVLVLFSAQFVLPYEGVRYFFCGIYLLTSFVLLILSKTRR